MKKIEQIVGKISCGNSNGTAFLIDSEHVLTSAHIINNGDPNNIILEFWSIKKNEKLILNGKALNLAESNEKMIDAVVIKLDVKIEEAIFYNDLVDTQIPDDISWCSFGYPKNKSEGVVLRGQINHVVYDDQYHPPKWDIDLFCRNGLSTYKGASGSPLIINEKIVGLLVEQSSTSLAALSINRIKPILTKFDIHTFNLIKPERPIKKNPAFIDDYIPKTVVEYNSNQIKLGEPLLEVVKNEKLIVLSGDAGSGKSFELKYLCNELLKEWNYYPYPVDLRNYNGENINQWTDNIDTIIESYMPVVILDGYDEIKDRNLFIGKLQLFITNYDCKIVISTRSNFHVSEDKGVDVTFTGFTSYSLEKLSISNIVIYLEKVFKAKYKSNWEEKFEDFNTKIERYKLSNLLLNPFYLINLKDYYLKKNNIPKDQCRLVRFIIRETLQKDVNKYFHDSISPTLERKKIKSVITKIAFVSLSTSSSHFTESELSKVINSRKKLELVKKSAFINKAKELNKTRYSFTHNNIPEYLTAKMVSRRGIDELIKIMTLKENANKINPKWLNVLSFLINNVSKKKSEKIVDWLLENDEETITNFETTRIPLSKRERIFLKIFNIYSEKDRIINWGKYNFEKLINFSISDRIFDFLIENLKIEISSNIRISSINLIYSIYPENFKFNKIDLKEKLLDNIFNGAITVLSLSCLIKHCPSEITEDEMDKLVDKFITSENQDERYDIMNSINTLNKQSRYIEQVLSALKGNVNETPPYNRGYLNESLVLKSMIDKVQDENTIIKILKFYNEEYDNFGHSNIKDIENIIIYAGNNYPANEIIYSELKKLLLQDGLELQNDLSIISNYFHIVEKQVETFKEIYKQNSENLMKVRFVLQKISDEKCIDFIVQEFKAGRVDDYFLKDFLFSSFCDEKLKISIRQQSGIEIRKNAIEPYEVRKNKEIEKNRRLLFNMNDFINEIEKYYEFIGKDEISHDDYIIKDLERFEKRNEIFTRIIIDTFFDSDKNKVFKKDEFISNIKNNWVDYSIDRIHHYLITEREKIILTEEETNFIKKWCDKKEPIIKFKESITYHNRNSTSISIDPIHELFSFFIRRCSFKCYRQDMYLDLLSFVRVHDTEIELFDFVQGCITEFDLIKNRVFENLEQGIKFDLILSKHLEYIRNNKIKEVAPYLIQYILNKKNAFNKQIIIDTYHQLDGSPSELFNILPQIDDRIKYDIVSSLIGKYSNRGLKAFLKKEISNEIPDNHRYEAIKLLIQMQSLEGVRLFIKKIKSDKKFPIENNHFYPFLYFTKTKIVPLLFKFLELSGDNTIDRDEVFSNPIRIFHQTLQNIALQKNNFTKVEKLKNNYLNKIRGKKNKGESEIEKKMIEIIEFHWENIEKKYYQTRKPRMSIKKAIKQYDEIVKYS